MLDAPSETTLDALLIDVRSVVDEQVRPVLLADGVEIEVLGIDDDRIVQIRLNGTCQGCSSATMTLTFEVEAILKRALPAVRFVEPVL